MSISANDRERISRAIHVAEAETSGEIVCVFAKRSFDAAPLPFIFAAVVALALPWLLVATTAMPVLRILSFQIIAFVAAAALVWPPRMRRLLVPPALRRAIAGRVAAEQFVSRGVAETKDRSGILIFVSLAERYARIIADEGIAARVPQSEWQGAVDALVAHMRGGRIADGYVTAIADCGRVLANHFPRHEPKANELRDRIYTV
jgi:putative membrane protein